MPSYSYNTNIPAAANLLSDDQPDMQTNTNSINSLLGGDATVDMIGFGNANGGWHRQLTYVVQGSAPGSSSGQARTYSKTSSGSSEIFLQRDNVATEIQLTRGTPSAATSGYTFLPGGILLQWVQRTATGAFNWPIAFTTSVYGATLGYNNALSGLVPNLTSLTVSGATLNNSSTATVFIMAVGV